MTCKLLSILESVFGTHLAHSKIRVSMSVMRKCGDYQYQAIVRRIGYESQSKTFTTMREAQSWSSVVESEMSVLLGKREEEPSKGKWAMPGGVLRIDLDKTLEEAAQRVSEERIGVRLPYLKQQ